MSVVILLSVTWPLSGLARAAGGDLDPAFSKNGKLTTAFPEGGATGRGIAIQSDGKIVVAGVVGSDFGFARYNSDGTLDVTFDGDGRVTTSLTTGADVARAVAIQSNGKIVAVGVAGQGSPDPRFALARYNPNGTLDSTFGGNGKVTTNFTAHEDVANAVAIQSDGKIVVAGTKNQRAFALARYTHHGRLDLTFGGDGRVVTKFASFGIAYGVAIQANGKIVAVGTSATAGGLALARYRQNGSLDRRFRGDGTVLTYLAQGYGGEAHAVALQQDGKIVIAGTANDIFGPFVVARYTARGRLDTTFSGNGVATTHMGGGEESAGGVVIQSDAKIVVAGYAGVPHEFGDPGTGGIAVARYLSNGILDPLFSGDGKIRTRFSAGIAVGLCVALQGNGKIVAAGAVAGQFAVARYLS